MSAAFLTEAMVERTLHHVDGSGILELLSPVPPAFRRGRKGNIRENTRLLLIGIQLCTRLGRETTINNVHAVLTESLDRQMQWDLGVLRPLTTKKKSNSKPFDPEEPTLTKRGKKRKAIWGADGVEAVGYDDLINAVRALNNALGFGNSVTDISDEERVRRRDIVEEVSDRLITNSVIARTGSSVAIDATGQWAWSVGSERGRTKAKNELERQLAAGEEPVAPQRDLKEELLEVAGIASDENGKTAPAQDKDPESKFGKGTCQDAAWGYKTARGGGKEVGFGFHQHTLVRTPDPNQPPNSEPLLVEAFVVVPANSDVVDPSLRIIDLAAARSPIKRVHGDALYTNLKADRWAVPLAQRGIEQVLPMRSDSHGITDINGALMQHGWMHCPAAPMDRRPIPAKFAYQDTDEFYDSVDEFYNDYAFSRKESGLGKNPSSKWICPAMAGRVGCHARGEVSVAVARDEGLPVITPPEDWPTMKCCTSKTMDFTPDPTNPDHQRKLAQREYFGSRRHRIATNARSLVEGTFGILKNPSRQRMRRGQNRTPGLVMANLVNGLKIALFNEEQLRSWHEDTGKGPVDHPLLKPDPYDWGFKRISKDEAKEIDRRNLARIHGIGDETAA